MACCGQFGTNLFNTKMKKKVPRNLKITHYFPKKLKFKKVFSGGKIAILSIDFASNNCESADNRLLWVIVLNKN